MNISAYAVVFDCGNAGKLAQFWSTVLGRPVDSDPSEEFASIGPGRGGAAPSLVFTRVPEVKTVKNRVHLDLTVAALDDEVERVIAAGAREAGRFEEDGSRWVTLTDPDGNEFDLVAG